MTFFCNFLKSENVNQITSKYLEIKNKSKTCLTNLDFVQSYAPMHKFCACFFLNLLIELKPSSAQLHFTGTTVSKLL